MKIRPIAQIIGSILPNSYFQFIVTKTIYQGRLKGICAPLFNCYACPFAVVSCPIGTLQHFSAIGKIPYYVIGYLGIIGLAVGRMACGWICPFGFFQDLIAKIKIRKFRIPSYLGYMRYFALVVLVFIIPFFTHEPWFTKLCPWGTMEAGIPWILIKSNFRSQIGNLYYLKLAILAGFLGLMLIFKRPFCFLVCPLGAIFALFNKISVIRLGVDIESCTKCNKCLRDCPVDIKVYENPNSHNCIRCLECTKCSRVSVYSMFSEKPMRRKENLESGQD